VEPLPEAGERLVMERLQYAVSKRHCLVLAAGIQVWEQRTLYRVKIGHGTCKYGSTDEARKTGELLGNINILEPLSTLIDLFKSSTQRPSSRGGAQRKKHRQKAASEIDRRLECDHDFIMTSDAFFHTDHTNLCIWMVPITTCELSEILWSRLVGNRDTVNKRPGMRKGGLRLRGVRYHMMLGNAAKGVMFLIHLQ
jgi:hypothetical protein